MKYILLLGLIVSLFNCRNTAAVSSATVDPSVWMNSYFDSVNKVEAGMFETPKILTIDGYRQVNDKVVAVIVNENDQLVCTKKYLWVFIDRKPSTSYIEIFRGCDRDYSQTSFAWKEFATKDTVSFNVTEYAYNAKQEYLDSTGNYKKGFDNDNVDYVTDSFSYIIGVRQDGSVLNGSAQRK